MLISAVTPIPYITYVKTYLQTACKKTICHLLVCAPGRLTMVVRRTGCSFHVNIHHRFYKPASLTSTANTLHLPKRETNKAMSSPT